MAGVWKDAIKAILTTGVRHSLSEYIQLMRKLNLHTMRLMHIPTTTIIQHADMPTNRNRLYTHIYRRYRIERIDVDINLVDKTHEHMHNLHNEQGVEGTTSYLFTNINIYIYT